MLAVPDIETTPSLEPSSQPGTKVEEDTSSEPRGTKIRITYYTDPLCSWSWAFEPQWRRLRYEFGQQVAWRYRLGGMIPDWQSYSDPLNDVSRPVQMGPQWFQVGAISEMPFEEHIWYEDPPTSSYPASIAIKAAEQQGGNIGERYLRRVREAVMLERRNVARQEVLLQVAEEMAKVYPAFDVQQFHQTVQGQDALEAFREDVKEARYRNIGRFPTMILQASEEGGIIFVGYRPYDVLLEAVSAVAPDCAPLHSAPDVISYATFWQRVTAKEVAEAVGLAKDVAEQQLEAAVAEGVLRKEGQGHLYVIRDA